MAEGSTSPGHATRTVETTRGVLTYAQLAPLLAERVLAVEQQIAAGDFSSRVLDGDFTRQLHAAIAGDLVPEWAGQWRTIAVQVGAHESPLPHEIPVLMRVYADDLAARLAHLTDDLILETLAFAEGRFLSIHPFRDFNGRVTRLFLRELLRRLDLPPVDLVPTTPADEPTYFAALRAGDTLNWQPLAAIWQQRFERFSNADEPKP
jgi:CRISPR-associated endonuclease/helicase Cas3